MREKIVMQIREIDERIVEDENKDLIASGILDSFDIVNLVFGLEEAFGIEIDADLVTPDNFRTAEAIIKLMENILTQ